MQSVTAARAELREVRTRPVIAARPVVVLAGLWDPGIGPARIAPALRDVVGEENVLALDFFTETNFDSCREKVLDAVEARWPDMEVDVIGHSMGGLIGRYAAVPNKDGRFLKIGRLYTMDTPHQGARLAWVGSLDPKARDMFPGSEFLRSLDKHLETAPYELIPYAIKGDAIVGVKRCAPLGYEARRASMLLPFPSHLNAMGDPRLLADVIREISENSTQ